MNTVNGDWRRPSSSEGTDLEAQTITGVHASFALPVAPEPVRVAAVSTRTPRDITDAVDSFFGVTRPRATRESQHDSHPSLGGEMSPPSYADADLPVYSVDPNTEPITLAMYLFKFGFRTSHSRFGGGVTRGWLTLFAVFPPLWILGAIIWITPLTVPADFEPSKSGTERQQLAQIVRNAEVRWAKRCVWALVGLLVLANTVTAVTLALMYWE